MAEDENMREGTPNTPENPAEPIASGLESPKGLTRRGFLKGLAALFTVAAVGKQENGESTQPDEAVVEAAPEDAPVTEELANAPESLIPAPNRANIPVLIAGTFSTFSPEQRAISNSQATGAKDSIIKISNVYEQLGVPELQESMRSYVAAVAKGLRDVPDYALPLGQKQDVTNVVFPDFGDRESLQSKFLNLNIINPGGAGSLVRYRFGFEPMQFNDLETNEAPLFDFYATMLRFNKYKELVDRLPETAFADIPALVRWLNSDDVKFRLDVDVYKEIAEVYGRVAPKVREQGVESSNTFALLYRDLRFYQTIPSNNPTEPKEFFWLRAINDRFYHGTIPNLNPDRAGVFLGPRGAGRFLRPLDIPWQ